MRVRQHFDDVNENTAIRKDGDEGCCHDNGRVLQSYYVCVIVMHSCFHYRELRNHENHVNKTVADLTPNVPWQIVNE